MSEEIKMDDENPLLTRVKNDLCDDDLNYNSCVYASHYDSSAIHDWAVGILVDSLGSYYWVS